MSESRQFRGALAWSFVLNGVRQALTGIFTLALAAMLGPAEFGTVTIALTYILFLQLFLDYGVGDAIVQRRELDEEHLTAAFWMLLGGSLFLAAVSFALAPWWAAANRVPELTAVTIALTLSLPLHALFAVHQALLRRQMDFRSLAILVNLAVLASGALGFVLARRGWGVWALVVYQLAIPTATVGLYWTFTRWRPTLRFSRQAARDLVGFSAGSLLGALGTFLNVRADALVMGLLFGPAAVGAYRLAERLVGLVIESAARPVQAVALPEFARLQDQPELLAAAALRCIRISAICNIAPLAVLAAGAEEVTRLIGPHWSDAAGALRWLCLAGVCRSLSLFLSPLLIAVGRPHALAGLVWTSALPSALLAIGVGLFLRDAPLATQASGIGASRAALFALFSLPVAVAWGSRLVGLRLRSLLAVMAPSLLSAAVAAATLALVRWIAILDQVPPRIEAFLVLAAGAAAGAGALVALDGTLRSELWRLGRRIFGRSEA